MGTRGKIPVVDDSAIVRASARWALEGAGYDVAEFESPFMFRQALSEEKPDLVLMDVSMPGLRGDTLLAIGQRYGEFSCPVVLFWSQPSDELYAIVTALRLAGFITKDLTLLLAEVGKYLP
jgi:CheY-like chemotaxis protein